MWKGTFFAIFALAFAAPTAMSQQADPYPGAIIYPGQLIPAGYHVHPHGNHGHLHNAPDTPQPQQNQVNAAQREYLRQMMISERRQQIERAQQSYRQCVELRSGTTSSVYRSSMDCERWLTLAQQLQMQILQLQMQR
jgi:hypothetical protein